jgi:hypothetical protein
VAGKTYFAFRRGKKISRAVLTHPPGFSLHHLGNCNFSPFRASKFVSLAS